MLPAIVAGVLLGLVGVEAAYRLRGIPLPQPRKKDIARLAKGADLMILGDSRADAGLDPWVIGQILGDRAVNLGQEGWSPINQLQILKLMNVHPRILLIAVSPASVYGAFYRDPAAIEKAWLREQEGEPFSRVMKFPFKHSEAWLSSHVKAHLHIGRGFAGLVALFRGHVVEYRDSLGWNRVSPLGERRNYVRLVNLEAYEDHILKRPATDLSVRDERFAQAVADLAPARVAALVRLPCSPELRAIEDRAFPDFDARMGQLAVQFRAPYIWNGMDYDPDWSKGDGSHLTAGEARDYSTALARRLFFLDNAEGEVFSEQGGRR